jgi:hypothetical protein
MKKKIFLLHYRRRREMLERGRQSWWRQRLYSKSGKFIVISFSPLCYRKLPWNTPGHSFCTRCTSYVSVYTPMRWCIPSKLPVVVTIWRVCPFSCFDEDFSNYVLLFIFRDRWYSTADLQKLLKVSRISFIPRKKNHRPIQIVCIWKMNGLSVSDERCWVVIHFCFHQNHCPNIYSFRSFILRKRNIKTLSQFPIFDFQFIFMHDHATGFSCSQPRPLILSCGIYSAFQ